MKCPTCGQWNKADLPRCFSCGTALIGATGAPRAWQDALRDEEPDARYIQYEEGAMPAVAVQDEPQRSEEDLGVEMDRLKQRRQIGEEQLAKLRQHARQAQHALANAPILEPLPEDSPFAVETPTFEPAQDVRMPLEERAYLDAMSGMPADAPAARAPRNRRTARVLPPQPPQPSQPQDWRGHTDAAYRAQRDFIYTDDQNAPVLYDGYSASPSDEQYGARGMDPDPMVAERDKAAWTTSSRPPAATTYARGKRQTLAQRSVPVIQPHARHRFLFLKILLAAVGVVALVGLTYVGMDTMLQRWNAGTAEALDESQATVLAGTLDGQPSHTVYIAGKEGAQVYVRELQKSYVITGGVAEIQIADYFWYEGIDTGLSDQMEVVLNPAMKTAAGEQTPLPVVRYTIDVPLSAVRLIRPESLIADVSTSRFDLRLQVDRGSRVIVQGEDITDLIDANGRVSKSVQVFPIGENRIQVSVRSRFCRPNDFEILLNRPPQDIPLEMASDTESETSKPSVKLFGSTVPGATITIDWPHENLDVSKVDIDGTFSFEALFSKIGDNEVIVRASYPGLHDSMMSHVMYYMPSVDIYSRRAWPFDRAHYLELINLNADRKGTIYECKGIITSIISARPQLAIMDTGTDEREQLVLLENSTKTQWEVGTYYRIYGDAFGMYDNIPRITARYTYLD